MKGPNSVSWGSTLALALLGGAMLLAANAALRAEEPAAGDATKEDTRDQESKPRTGLAAAVCLDCHENSKIDGIFQTPHADVHDPDSPAAKKQCESCHGPSEQHMKYPMQVGNIRFTKHSKTPIAQRNQACLSCHKNGERKHWNEGAHGEKLACNDCHVIHRAKDPALAKTGQAQRCAKCHEDILAKAPDPSSHPLTGEHAIRCTECHNPHGPTSLAKCADCHPHDAKTLAKQSEKARDYHERALAKGIECTRCHKGFVHALPQITRAAVPAQP